MNISESLLFTKEIDRLNMNVSEAAHAQLEPGHVFSAARPAFTRVYGILKGSGTIHCAGRDIPLQSGSLYILPTGLDFSYNCHTAVEKVYYHIHLLRYSKYDLFRDLKDCVVLTQRQQTLCQAVDWLRQADAFSAMQTKVWLYQLVLEGFQITGTDFGPIEEYSPLVKQAIWYVEEKRRSGLTAATIAAALYVSESRLQKTFRREVGVPLGRYINDQLFFDAEQQLRLTDRSIREISDELGFCDPFYFSRMFTERYGIPPSRYRKRINP